VLLLSSCASSTPTVLVRPIWIDGPAVEDRVEIDEFLDCLVNSSTLPQWWEGEVRIELAASQVIPAPPSTVDWSELADLLPQDRGGTSAFLVFGEQPHLRVGACGRNDVVSVGGRPAALGVVRTRPLCWPTGDRVRTETQIATHELVESVDALLGHAPCAGGGACRGRTVCPDRCDTFVGLQCAGAPETTWTGCDGGAVEGWLTQSFGRQGRDQGACEACIDCDFVPRLRRSRWPRWPAWAAVLGLVAAGGAVWWRRD